VLAAVFSMKLLLKRIVLSTLLLVGLHAARATQLATAAAAYASLPFEAEPSGFAAVVAREKG
jgi:hypothetical protein